MLVLGRLERGVGGWRGGSAVTVWTLTSHGYRALSGSRRRHLRRLLNQTLFDKIYITTNPDTGHLTTTIQHQPPFDSILTWTPTDTDTGTDALDTQEGDEEQERDEEQAAAAELGTPGPEAGVHENGPGLGVDLVHPHQTRQTRLTTTPQAPQTPLGKQKPASWVNHDAGLSVRLMVGVTRLELATSRPPAVRATNCATPRSLS